jgi:hypothetical protein
MAMDRNVLAAAFKPYLEPGEELIEVAYGVKQPNMVLIAALIALAVLPGVIAVFLLTKHYVVGLTNRRLMVLRIKASNNASVREIIEYPLSNLPPVKSSTGSIFTRIKLIDPAKPFAAKFHRLGMQGNRESAMAIAAALTGQAPVVRAAPLASQPADDAWIGGSDDRPVVGVAPPASQPPPAKPPPRTTPAAAARALVLKIGPVTRALTPGMSIEPPLLGAAGAGRGKGPIAEITNLGPDHTTRFLDPEEELTDFGLHNLSDRVYLYRATWRPEGETFKLGPDQTVRLWVGMVIDFGGIQGLVQRAGGDFRDAPRTLYGPPPRLNR